MEPNRFKIPRHSASFRDLTSVSMEEEGLEDTIDRLLQILRDSRADDLYYAKGRVQRCVRTCGYSACHLKALSAVLFDEAPSVEPYQRLLLGVLCGERVRIENGVDVYHQCNDAVYNSNLEMLEQVIHEEYAEFLHFPGAKDEAELAALRAPWLRIVSGSVEHLEVTRNSRGERLVRYSDHVTRMQSAHYGRIEHLHNFVIPRFKSSNNNNDNKDFLAMRIHADRQLLEQITDERSRRMIAQPCRPFCYERLEDSVQGDSPVILPLTFEDFNASSSTAGDGRQQRKRVCTQCLHLPLKLSAAFCTRFNAEGRRLPNGDAFHPDVLYLPEELAGTDMLAALQYACSLEKAIDAQRFRDNFVLLTFRTGVLQRGQSLGNTGWHIDGHQGVERIQKNGEKVPIDRTYCVSNVLPTQITSMRLNLDPVRALAERECLTLDQFNIQNIIQHSVTQAGAAVVKEAPANTLYYANPYCIHQSPVNPSSVSVDRSFARILFTVDERDRIGDTINPLMGPIYPFKIKQIVDIRQYPPQATD